MSTEANKEVVRSLVRDLKNRGNPANAAQLLSSDYTHHFHIPGQDIPQGLAGSMRVGEIFGEAFPKIEVTLEVLIAEDDYVLERSSVVAFHGGPLLGIPATNKDVTWTENHLYRFEDGKIAEHWPEADFAGVLAQIGALG